MGRCKDMAKNSLVLKGISTQRKLPALKVSILSYKRKNYPLNKP
jgi:hypothetical protein